MDFSSSMFDFDFGAGFDDFGVKAFDNFGADFERAFAFDFLGTTLDTGSDNNVEESVDVDFDMYPLLGICQVVIVFPIREDVFGVRIAYIVSIVF